MALVDTDYVNCATVVVESQRARLLAAHSIDLLDLRSIYSCYRFAAQCNSERCGRLRCVRVRVVGRRLKQEQKEEEKRPKQEQQGRLIHME
jgi:hypothetical protein